MEVSSACISLRVRAEDLALALELLADVVRHPVFPLEALDWGKRRMLAELQSDLEDPAFQADLMFRSLVYGAHPLGRDPRGRPRDVRLLTRQDVVDHHRRHFAPDRAFLVAVGDFEPRTLSRLVQASLRIMGAAGRAVRRLSPWSATRPSRGSAGWSIPASRCTSSWAIWASPAITPISRPWSCSITSSAPARDSPTGSAGSSATSSGWSTASAAASPTRPTSCRASSASMPGPGPRRPIAWSRPSPTRSGPCTTGRSATTRSTAPAATWPAPMSSTSRPSSSGPIGCFELERLGLSLDEPRHWSERIARITPRQVRQAAKAHLRPEALFRVEYGPLIRRGQKMRVDCA